LLLAFNHLPCGYAQKPMPNYLYADTNGVKQSINEYELKELAARGVITPTTPLEMGEHQGLAGQIPDLKFNTAAPPSGNVFCTNCGNSVSEQAVACMSCGAKPAGHKKFCRHCGTTLNPEQVVCLECGKAIEKAGISVVAAFRSPKDMRRTFREITAKAKRQPSLVLVSIGIGGLSSVPLHFFTSFLWLIPVFGIVILIGVLIRFPSEY